jgi:hypothetical protein
MKNLKYILFFFAICILITIPLAYKLYIENEIISLYNGQKSGYFHDIISLIYPRFFIEIHRFDLTFFLSHANQVIWRFELLGIIILSSIYLYSKHQNFKTKIDSFWNIDGSDFNSKIYYFVSFAAILWYMHDFIEGYKFWLNYKELYSPILLFKVLQIPLWSIEIVTLLFAIFVIASLATMFRIYLKFNSLIVCLLFILFQGWNYSFGKINHGFALLTYITIILSTENLIPKINKAHALQLIRITIASCYLMAGLEKLFISQFSWISATTFSAYLLQHPTEIGMYIVKSKLVCTILPSIALTIQLGFILILFVPKLKNWILISGILFHFGTVVLFDIGSYFHPWIITYVFFIDWEKIFKSKRN